ncbi:DUF4097 family beta strand repeat-containing protein [Nonomuraea dietziae]|uniref:DUF4097 family beta strand repeat-containing protein n=1 Tax=Nonomuraea dietziae TaxID=65515 RepID=UPI003426D6D6
MNKKGVIAAAGLLASATLLTGCGLAGIGGPTEEKTVSYEVKDDVVRLTVKGDAGAIVVNGSDRTGIKVTENMHWRNEQPKPFHEVNGDALELSYDCKKGWNSCWIDYTIEVPKGVVVKTDSGAGDITLRSLSGEIEVTTGAGDIDANGLTGKRLFAETGAGDIKLKYESSPDKVELETGAGTSTLYLPQGAYDVTADTGAGSSDVKVTDDAASPRKVVISSGAGDVKVLPV